VFLQANVRSVREPPERGDAGSTLGEGGEDKERLRADPDPAAQTAAPKLPFLQGGGKPRKFNGLLSAQEGREKRSRSLLADGVLTF